MRARSVAENMNSPDQGPPPAIGENRVQQLINSGISAGPDRDLVLLDIAGAVGDRHRVATSPRYRFEMPAFEDRSATEAEETDRTD